MQAQRIERMAAAVLLILLATVPAAGQPAPVPANPDIRPFVGDWVGQGWGTEVRFKQSQRDFVRQFPGAKSLPAGPETEKTIMSLTVKHVTHYHFTVDSAGVVAGEGQLTYDLFPNLCGVAALTKQVNEQVNMMAKLPTIFKMATEIGTRSAERFSQEFYREESKLADKVTDIVAQAKAYEKAGGPANAAVYDPKTFTSLLLKKGQPKDVQDLVIATVYGRCFDPTQRIAGSSRPCLDLLVRPVSKSVQETGETVFNAILKQVFDMLKDTTKAKLKNIGSQSQREAAACSGTGNALRGGTQVGPATAAELGLEMGAVGAKAAMEMATGSAPHSMLLSIPGVTQVQYSYKGLPHGPEARDFKIKGRLQPVAGGAQLHLEMDGDVGGGDKRLYVEYTVNYRKDTRSFPTWSPFTQNPGDAKRFGTDRVYRLVETNKPVQYTDPVTGKTKTVSVPQVHKTYDDVQRTTPFATLHETGTQRKGVKVWHEYEYVWNAWKVMEPVSAGAPSPPLALGRPR